MGNSIKTTPNNSKTNKNPESRFKILADLHTAPNNTETTTNHQSLLNSLADLHTEASVADREDHLQHPGD